MGLEMDKSDKLMATVYLRSESGRSLLDKGNMAVPVDPASYMPTPETIEKAITELERLGFIIETQGVTLSISGSADLFEQICGITISHEKRTLHEPGKSKPVVRSVYVSSQPVMRINKLNHIVEGMVFAAPGAPFS